MIYNIKFNESKLNNKQIICINKIVFIYKFLFASMTNRRKSPFS